jgi:YegS/Rv2252/BmrU family lipid kinase
VIKAVFIINSKQKKSNYVSKVISLTEKSLIIDLNICYTEYEKHAKLLAEKMSHKSDIIIAVGGDGTCNEVVNGIYNSGNKNIILGILPNGTGNDFSRMLNVLSPHEFVKKLELKDFIKIDIGEIVFQQSKSVFINIADIGFGVKVVELMNKQRLVGVKGKFSYATAIIRAFFSYKKIPISISGDHFNYSGNILMVAFCNGNTFGNGIVINPFANITDGKLDLTVIGNVSLITYLKHLGKLKKGEKINHPEVKYYHTKTIKINSINPQQKIEADGELFGNSIKEINLLKGRICLIN